MSDQVFTHQRSKNFGKVPSEVMHDKTLTDGAVRQYAHMHWRGGKILESFEGLISMADYLGVNEKTIRNRVKELEARDWVMVVQRDPDPKSNTFKTHIYHIFEYQVDCASFRKEYKAADGETVREKSEKEDRKTRKGAGGNPKLRATPTQEPPPVGTQFPDTPIGTQVPAASGTQVPAAIPEGRWNSSSNYPEGDIDSLYPEKALSAPSTPNTSEAPLSSLRSESPLKSDAFEAFVDTLDIDDVSPEPNVISEDELISAAEYEALIKGNDKPALYECKPTDIAEMIAAWWEWVPARPSARGKPTTLGQQISIPTNREYAKNLFERGVRPIDFVQVLFPLWMAAQKGGVVKEMPFQYVCPMVDQHVAEHWQDDMMGVTQEDPRYAPKKPNGKVVHFGENVWERDDLFVDLRPRYIAIRDLEVHDDTFETFDSSPAPEDSWTAEDWAKNGDPL